jgi:hypothetical protein
MKLRAWIVASSAGAAALFIGHSSAGQQLLTGTQDLSFDRPESWALKYTASETLPIGLGPPRSVAAWSFKVGLEIANLPRLSKAQRTVGFDGTKEEDLNKIPILARPRLTLGLPGDVSVFVAWIPPIEIDGAQPNLLSFAVGRPILDMLGFTAGLRAYGQIGSARGDFTCSADNVAAGKDPLNNPLGCTQKSSDRALLNYGGLELAAAYAFAALNGVEIHASVAVTYMALSFDVQAQYAGVVDSTSLTTQGVTFATSGGLGIPVWMGLRVGLDVFYSPLYVRRPPEPLTNDGLLNVRALVEYAL